MERPGSCVISADMEAERKLLTLSLQGEMETLFKVGAGAWAREMSPSGAAVL